MCTDSRAINKIIIEYRFPTSKLDDMMEQLFGVIIFFKIDLRSRFNQIHVGEGDEWRTTFKTRDVLHELIVIPFKLSNVPNMFMRNSLEEHLEHLR